MPNPPQSSQSDTGWHDAGREAYWAWEELAEARNLSQQASAVDRLSNAMGNLVSWLPGWDWEHGVLKDPEDADAD